MRKIVLLGALALGVGARVDAAPLPDAVPVEVFAALPMIEDPKLSPDGIKVAGKIAVNGKQMLLVQPLFGSAKPEDKRVPVKQSRMLISELQKAGKPYDYLEQKLADHHFSRAEDRLEFLNG